MTERARICNFSRLTTQYYKAICSLNTLMHGGHIWLIMYALHKDNEHFTFVFSEKIHRLTQISRKTDDSIAITALGDNFLFHLQKRLNTHTHTHTALQASRATIALTHTHNQVYFEPWKTDLQERRQGYSIAAFFQPGSARAAVAHNGHMVNSGSNWPNICSPNNPFRVPAPN